MTTTITTTGGMRMGDTAEPGPAEDAWLAGMYDTARVEGAGEGDCGARSPRGEGCSRICTRPADHDGRHLAGIGNDLIVAAWPGTHRPTSADLAERECQPQPAAEVTAWQQAAASIVDRLDGDEIRIDGLPWATDAPDEDDVTDELIFRHQSGRQVRARITVEIIEGGPA